MSAVASPHQRRASHSTTASLNERFQTYIEKVNTMREQCKKHENNVFLSQVQALQFEIHELKNIYERELNTVREQLDAMTSQRNSLHVEQSKNGAQLQELQAKHAEELANKKKMDTAIADSHRLLAEKDALIQELRINISQHQNNSQEAQGELEELRKQVAALQQQNDAETRMRTELEATTAKLSAEISFERKLHEKELIEVQNKVAAGERALEIADEKLRESDKVMEKLQQQIENIRRQTQHEFQQYQEQSEHSYSLQLQDHRNKLEKETLAHAQQREENIQLKAVIEEMNVKISKLQRQNWAVGDQNRNLIHTLEVERRTSAAIVMELEENLRTIKDSLNEKVRELNAANNATLPIEIEMEAFKTLLESEEKRLKVALSNPPSELCLSSRGELLSNRNQQPTSRGEILSNRNQQQNSPPGSPLRQSPVARGSFSRPKSTPLMEDGNKSPTSNSMFPSLTDRAVRHPPRTFGNTTIPLLYSK